MKTQSKEKNKSFKLLIILASLIVALGIGAGICYMIFFEVTDNTVVARVKGLSITALELKDQMKRDKTNAISYFKENYNVAVDEDFWNKEFDSQTPSDYLKNYSLEELKKDKLVIKLALENEVIEEKDSTYTGFLKNLEQENIERAQKVAKGEPIYGPKTYTKDTYYDYFFSTTVLDLQKALAKQNSPLNFNESELKAFYEQEKEVRYPKSDKFKVEAFTLTFESLENDSQFTYEQSLEIMKAVKKIIKNDSNYKQVIKDKYPQVEFRNLKMDDENASSVQKSTPNMFETTRNLSVNQVSEVFEENNSCVVIKCISRTADGFKDFEHYKDGISKEFLEYKYNNYINELLKQTKVEVLRKFDYIKVF